MGIIRATARPYYYTRLEQEPPIIPEVEPLATGLISLSFCVAGTGYYLRSHQQKMIESILSPALGEKGAYVRDYISSDNRGFYTWGAQYAATVDGLVTTKRADITLRGNRIQTGRIPLMEMGRVKDLIDALQTKGFTPEGDIQVTYYPMLKDRNKACHLLPNLVNIIEARRPLIEQALSLQVPLEILITPEHGLALSISLSAFSYPAIEAAAFLIEQACKMAQTTGKARMKPCDGSNPKYQMRSWLLRLGFIGEEFERPRKTLLAGLEGDTAFYTAGQKEAYMTKRRTKRLNDTTLAASESSAERAVG